MIRRRFIDTPSGQMHIRYVGDPNERSKLPIMCLHQSPASSWSYIDLLSHMKTDRFTFAPDTPGFGESFRPKTRPSITDYANWLAALPQAMNINRLNLVGYFTGAAIAAEIAVHYPELVNRLVLIGPPLFTDEQQEQFFKNAWPEKPKQDGSHLVDLWQRIMNTWSKDIHLEYKSEYFHEFYRGGVNAIWGEMAVSEFNLSLALEHVTQPVLILQPDGIHGDGFGAHEIIRHSKFKHLEGLHGYGLFYFAGERVALEIESYFDEAKE